MGETQFGAPSNSTGRSNQPNYKFEAINKIVNAEKSKLIETRSTQLLTITFIKIIIIEKMFFETIIPP
jgi:hypothetical protein